MSSQMRMPYRVGKKKKKKGKKKKKHSSMGRPTRGEVPDYIRYNDLPPPRPPTYNAPPLGYGGGYGGYGGSNIPRLSIDRNKAAVFATEHKVDHEG